MTGESALATRSPCTSRFRKRCSYWPKRRLPRSPVGERGESSPETPVITSTWSMRRERLPSGRSISIRLSSSRTPVEGAARVPPSREGEDNHRRAAADASRSGIPRGTTCAIGGFTGRDAHPASASVRIASASASDPSGRNSWARHRGWPSGARIIAARRGAASADYVGARRSAGAFQHKNAAADDQRAAREHRRGDRRPRKSAPHSMPKSGMRKSPSFRARRADVDDQPVIEEIRDGAAQQGAVADDGRRRRASAQARNGNSGSSTIPA